MTMRLHILCKTVLMQEVSVLRICLHRERHSKMTYITLNIFMAPDVLEPIFENKAVW